MNLSDSKQRQLRRRSVLISVVLNTIVLAVAMIFSNMEFGTNDDRDISNLLADVYGTGYGHYITFVNVILCKALSCIYWITGNATNWYVLFSVVGSYLSMVAICYLLIYRSRSLPFGTAISVIVVGLLYESHYITFQFTQNAALITLAGVLLLTDVVLSGWGKGSLIQSAAGVVLAVLGSMIRFQSIYFTFPYLIMFVGYEMVFVKKPEGFQAWFKSRWKALTGVAVCVVLVLGARGVHNYVYQSNPVLKEFYEVNLLRVELLDYGFPSYQENAEAIEALGLTEEDIILFENQCFLDSDVFSREVLEALVEMKSEQASSYSMENLKLSSVWNVLRTVRSNMSENLVWQAMIVACIVFLLSTKRKRWLVALGCTVAPLVMIWYFVSVNRMPYRIWYSIVAPAVVCLFYLCAVGFVSPERENADKRKKISGAVTTGMVGILCAATVFSVGARAYEDDSVKITDTYERVLILAQQYPDKVVLLDRPTISGLTYNSTITPMTCLSAGSHHNICYQGGWICWTPANLSALSNYGTDNIYRAIGEGMEVILVDERTPEMKLSFIQRHYNPDVCMETIGAIGSIGIYRLYIP